MMEHRISRVVTSLVIFADESMQSMQCSVLQRKKKCPDFESLLPPTKRVQHPPSTLLNVACTNISSPSLSSATVGMDLYNFSSYNYDFYYFMSVIIVTVSPATSYRILPPKFRFLYNIFICCIFYRIMCALD